MKKLITILALVSVILGLLLAGYLLIFKGKTPLGSEVVTTDKQIVQAVETTDEISLLSLAIQGLQQKNAAGNFFGLTVPGSDRAMFIRYSFAAKLGLDGSQVAIEQTGSDKFTITIPKFKFIGYDEPTFGLAAEQNGVLSWITPQIDQLGAANEILGPDNQAEYLKKNDALLRQQTEAFYTNIVRAIDPDAQLTFVYAEDVPE